MEPLKNKDSENQEQDMEVDVCNDIRILKLAFKY